MSEIGFRSWEYRPAIVLKDPGRGFAAVAILEPGKPWSKVDALDVVWTADWAGANKVIGMHFDTFPPLVINHEEAKAKATAAGKELLLLAVGETISI